MEASTHTQAEPAVSMDQGFGSESSKVRTVADRMPVRASGSSTGRKVP